MKKILEAINFAKNYHGEQLRKYGNELYIFHPIRVGFILASIITNEIVIAAGILHDVLEDTDATEQEIFNVFGNTVRQYVVDMSNLHTGNRKERKRLYREQLRKADNEVKSIKLADFIDNAPSIIKYDPDFAKVWMAEQKELLPNLYGGNSLLYMKVNDMIEHYLHYFRKNNGFTL